VGYERALVFELVGYKEHASYWCKQAEFIIEEKEYPSFCDLNRHFFFLRCHVLFVLQEK
jgi:hypothetical protein